MGHFLQVSHNWGLCKMLGGEPLVMDGQIGRCIHVLANGY